MGDMAIMAAGTVVVVTGAVTTAVVPPVTPVVPVVTTSCRSLGAAPRRGVMLGRDGRGGRDGRVGRGGRGSQQHELSRRKTTNS